MELTLAIRKVATQLRMKLDHWLKVRPSFLKERLNGWLYTLGLNNPSSEISKKLPDLSANLEEVCKGVEPDFIQIGQELQNIYGDATGLAQQVMDSVKSIGSKGDDGVLVKLRRSAEESLAELRDCQKEVVEESALIKDIMEHMVSLSGICSLIGKVGMLLRIVGLNIGVESSRSLESRELFSVVTQDTGELSEKIKFIAEDSHDVLKSAMQIQRSAYSKTSKGLKEINQLGEDARKTVMDAVHEIEKLMTSTIQLVEQAGRHSKEISRRVGEIVMDIQFHDSMSQRVEHITKALHDVGQLLSGESHKKDSINNREKLDHGFSILRLQCAQLKEIVDQIEEVYCNGIRSFEAISKEIDGLLNHLSGLSSGTDENSVQADISGNPFDRSRSSFDSLMKILQQSEALMKTIRRAASGANEATERISERMQDIGTIGFETHLMAMNTIIKAAHLGQSGGAIEVLAQEIKQSSDQTGEFVKWTDELVDSVTASAEKLRHQSLDSEAEGKILLDSSLEEITQAYKTFTNISMAAREQAGNLKSAISETKSNLAFLPLLTQRLKGYFRQLEEIVGELSQYAPQKYSPDYEEADEISYRYTMQKEREVHVSLLYGSDDRSNERAGKKIFSSNKERQGKTMGTTSGADDNVELFIEGTPDQYHESDDVGKLFDSENGSKEGGEDELGENVELF